MNETLNFLKNCWNSKKEPNEFLNDVKTRNFGNPNQILFQLAELSNTDSPLSTFLDYASVLISAFSETIFADFDYSNITKGLLNIFAKNGSHLFSDIEIGSKENALFALKILEICVVSSDLNLQIEALKSLVSSPQFSVLVASGRLYCFPEYSKVRNLFSQFQLKNPNAFDLSYGHSYLETALFADKIIKRRAILEKFNATSIVAASFYYWMPGSNWFSLVGTYNTRSMYLKIVQNFIDSPSFMSAYIITNFYFRLLPGVAGSHVKADFIEKGSFNGKVVSDILARFQPSFLKEMKFPLTNEQLINLICSFPSTVQDSEYPEIIFSYPSLVSYYVPHIIELAYDPTQIESFLTIIKNIKSEYLEDFRMLVGKQNLLKELLDALMHAMTYIVSPDPFFIILDLYLSLLRFSWRSSAKVDREIIDKYTLSQTQDLSIFLRIMFGLLDSSSITENVSMEEFRNTYPIINRCLMFFKMLFHISDEEFPIVLDITKKEPYLWPMLLVWAKETKRKIALTIAKVKFPDTPLLNFLFTLFMATFDDHCNSPVPFLPSDYDYLKTFDIELSDLTFTLFRQIVGLPKMDDYWMANIYEIIVSWRAFSSKYGVVPFALNILEIMNFEMKKIPDKQLIDETYESVAFLICCSADGDSVQLAQLLDETLKIVFSSESETIEGSQGLAIFCLIILLGIEQNWEVSFKRIMSYCSSILNDKWDIFSPPMIFAIHIIKLCLYMPPYQPLIPSDLFKVLVRKNDWKTTIDFFIAMGLSKGSASPESPDIIQY